MDLISDDHHLSFSLLEAVISPGSSTIVLFPSDLL